MINIKKKDEIKSIKEGGKILANILYKLQKAAKSGVKTIELDQLAEKLIIEKGGVPSFKNYKGYPEDTPFPSTICASVNEQLVHTPASDYILKNGDILSIDIGMKYPKGNDGLFTDMASTIPIGKISTEAKRLIKITRRSLELGIKQIKPGNTVGDIGKAIQKFAENNGYSVNRQLVGHGVGYEVHEEPRIPNYYDKNEADIVLKEGMVVAIEPMVNVGEHFVETGDDGWAVITVDKKLCAHFEHTVAVTDSGFEILTLR